MSARKQGAARRGCGRLTADKLLYEVLLEDLRAETRLSSEDKFSILIHSKSLRESRIGKWCIGRLVYGMESGCSVAEAFGLRSLDQEGIRGLLDDAELPSHKVYRKNLQRIILYLRDCYPGISVALMANIIAAWNGTLHRLDRNKLEEQGFPLTPPDRLRSICHMLQTIRGSKLPGFRQMQTDLSDAIQEHEKTMAINTETNLEQL